MKYDHTDTNNAAHTTESAIMRVGMRAWIRWTRADCRGPHTVTVYCRIPD